MGALDDHIKRVTEKLRLLLKQYTHLQKENRKLELELETLKKDTEERKDYIAVLEQRIEVLKMTRSQLSEEERKMTEKRIRHFLKEIDQCIKFLNE